MFMRKIFLLICVIGIPCATWAQPGQASWTNLSGLRAGQKIEVVGADAKKHSGTFVSASDTAITFNEATGEQTLQKKDVRIVKLMENHHRLRNALIGAGVGAGAGAGIGAGIGDSGSKVFKFPGTDAAIFAIVGLGAGAAVGALLPCHGTIYNVNSH